MRSNYTVSIQILWHGMWPTSTATKFVLVRFLNLAPFDTNKLFLARFVSRTDGPGPENHLWYGTGTNFGIINGCYNPWLLHNSNWYTTLFTSVKFTCRQQKGLCWKKHTLCGKWVCPSQQMLEVRHGMAIVSKSRATRAGNHSVSKSRGHPVVNSKGNCPCL